MARLGLARTLPAVVLALCITLLVAALAGGAAQAGMRAASQWRAGLLGAGYGIALLLAFVMAHTGLNGFIAPIFDAPGGGLTPQDLFFNGYVRPALALLSVGALPAALFGGGFAWLCRRLGETPA